ncbi:hypothetical protein LJ739_13055 [Aestuariibacter halophilus]|uniref:YqaE/Pmp3 family membrane protein n=1 Tax=Fluctibacter halophilus TaxID=226011 RepID=A0ABS8GBJ0_9ALTE|nr:hypothetical protein [Aestuariibacter halophilus]MCC2617175.1 hypothetical protein [Aestuariibacter halophilus]
MAGQGSGGNVIAAICSFFIPGLGQLVQGRILMALIFFVAVSVGYFFWVLIIPGIIGAIFHLWAIVDAAKFRSAG